MSLQGGVKHELLLHNQKYKNESELPDKQSDYVKRCYMLQRRANASTATY